MEKSAEFKFGFVALASACRICARIDQYPQAEACATARI
jgi:hypothetical protein